MTPTQVAAIDAIIAQIKQAQGSVAVYARVMFIPMVDRQITELVQKLEQLKDVS